MRKAILLLALPLLLASCATGSGRGAGAERRRESVPLTRAVDLRAFLSACGAGPKDGLDLGEYDRFLTALPGNNRAWRVSPDAMARAVAYAQPCWFQPALRQGNPLMTNGYRRPVGRLLTWGQTLR